MAKHMMLCDELLFETPVKYGLFTSADSFENALDVLKVARKDRGDWLINDRSRAATHFHDCDGERFALVTIDGAGRDLVAVHALLVHEAAHVWQEIMERIGERSPSDEFEAYSLQRIAANLMYAWKEHTEKQQQEGKPPWQAKRKRSRKR